MVNKSLTCLLLSFLLYGLAAPCVLLAGKKPGSDARLRAENAAAFGRLYGYIRYFHPSDEAAKLDWDAFAIYGVKRAVRAETPEQLKRILETVFKPIAPTMTLYLEGDETRGGFKPELLEKKLGPGDGENLKVTAWQHRGLKTKRGAGIYKSVRINRDKISGEYYGMGLVHSRISAKKFRGKKIWLKAMVRASKGEARLWLEVERKNGKTGFSGSMEDRPVTSPYWKAAQIMGRVAMDAEYIKFGCLVPGEGQVFADNFQLMVNDKGRWRKVYLENAGFENGLDKKTNAPKHWTISADGYHVSMMPNQPAGGKRCLFISSKEVTGPPRLFRAMPKVGEYVEKKIGRGITCIIPLALYADGSGTYPHMPERDYKEFLYKIKMETPPTPDASDLPVRWAAVVTAWNVFQHFYPNFDIVDIDWQKQLPRFLKKSYADTDAAGFLYILKELTAQLGDSHATVHHPLVKNTSGFPFKVEWIENRAVITDSRDMLFERGDIIEAIDGINIKKYLWRAERAIGGSPQWKRQMAMRLFGRGEDGTTASLTVLRGNKVYEFNADRTRKGAYDNYHSEPISQVRKGIYYVNLGKLKMNVFRAALKKLADARGVVFDARGYVDFEKRKILAYLTDKPVKSPTWKVPLFAYPDRENMNYMDRDWSIRPAGPRITGKCVFLTHGCTVSASESFMSIVENYHLGEIVGQQTAGANGNINTMKIPGDYMVIWTGMRVLKQDGTLQHLNGIKPTIPIKRTIAGAREGRDEFLERALDWIEKNAPAKTVSQQFMMSADTQPPVQN